MCLISKFDTKIKFTLKKIKYYSITILIFVLFIELVLRLNFFGLKTYSEINYGKYISSYINANLKLNPNIERKFTTKEFVFMRKANSLGIVEKEPNEINQNSFKIMCIGDSFTEGVGVEKEEAWPNILGGLLNKKNPEEFEVINAGFSGADPLFMWKAYEESLYQYEPDLFIFLLNTTDINDIIIGNREYNGRQVANVKRPYWEWIYRYSYLFRAIIKISGAELNHYLMTKNEYAGYVASSCELLNYFITDIKANKNAIFVFHPFENELDQKNYDYDCIDKIIDEQEILDIKDVMLSDSLSYSQLYWEIDMHYNKQGQEFLAKSIYHYFLKEVQ